MTRLSPCRMVRRHAIRPQSRAQLADRRCRDDFFYDRAGRANAADRVGPVHGRMAADHRMAAAVVGGGLAGRTAKIRGLPAGTDDQPRPRRRRVPADLLARISPSAVGPADRPRLRPAARLVLAARPAPGRTQAAPGDHARAGRAPGRAGLGHGRLGPGRPPLGQPLPPCRPFAAGGRALCLHRLADPRNRVRAAGAPAQRSPGRTRIDRADRFSARRDDLGGVYGRPARRNVAQHLPHHVGLLDSAGHVRSQPCLDQPVRERYDGPIHPSLDGQAPVPGRAGAGGIPLAGRDCDRGGDGRPATQPWNCHHPERSHYRHRDGTPGRRGPAPDHPPCRPPPDDGFSRQTSLGYYQVMKPTLDGSPETAATRSSPMRRSIAVGALVLVLAGAGAAVWMADGRNQLVAASPEATAAPPAPAPAPAAKVAIDVPPVDPPAPPPTSAEILKPGSAAKKAAPVDPAGLSYGELKARADANDVPAMEEIARRLIQGVDIAKDQQAGAGWLLRAAQAGSAQSAFNVGVMYERGFVVERDSTKAIEWYRKAAAGNVAMAKHNLALLLRDGKGAPRNGKEAIELLRSAARQGMAASMFTLGDIYERGDAGFKDPAIALAWFAISAEFERQTSRSSESALGKMASQRVEVLQRILMPGELERAQQFGQAEFKQIVEALQPPKPAPPPPTDMAGLPRPAFPPLPPAASAVDPPGWPKAASDQIRLIQQGLVDLKLLREKHDGALRQMTS